jgi:hypothetical protein
MMRNKKWYRYNGELLPADYNWNDEFQILDPLAQEIILRFFPNLPVYHKGTIQKPEKLLFLSFRKIVKEGLIQGEICGRCGGTGKFSYNPVYGSECYGCDGVGRILPPIAEIHKVLFNK